MTDSDDRFAEHVRTVFDAYQEPVDPAALARLRADLGHAPAPGPAAAPDRAPARRQRGGRWRALAALVALAVAVGGGWLATRPGPSEPVVAEAVAPRADEESQGERGPDLEADRAPSPQPSPPRGRGSQVESGLASEASAGRREAPGARPASLPAGRAEGMDRGALVAATETGGQGSLAESVAAQDFGVAPDPADVSGRSVVVALAPLPPAASARLVGRVEPIPSRPLTARAQASDRSGVRIVVATTSAFAAGQRAEGAGVSAGLTRDWRLAPGLTLSGGAAASYNRFAFDPDGVTAAQAFSDVEQAPDMPVDVTTQSTLTTVALEIPLDLALDLVQTRRGRLSASAGLTSALYLAQTFEDRGQRVAGQPFTSASGDSRVALSSRPFETRETPALGRLDLARQLNLGLGLSTAGPRPLAVDVYTRLPLGGLTSRNLTLTTLGVRLRVALP